MWEFPVHFSGSGFGLTEWNAVIVVPGESTSFLMAAYVPNPPVHLVSPV